MSALLGLNRPGVVSYRQPRPNVGERDHGALKVSLRDTFNAAQEGSSVRRGSGNVGSAPAMNNGLRGLERGRGGATLRGQSTAPSAPKPSIDVNAQAGLLAAAFAIGDDDTILEIFHGKTSSEQRRLISAFNRRPDAQLDKGVLWSTKRDFYTRVESLDGNKDLVLHAYIRNRSGRLEGHDQLHFSLKGLGTYEENVFRVLQEMDHEAIQVADAAYRKVYHPAGLASALRGEFSGHEARKVLLLLRGKDQISQAHFDALDLYRYGVDQMGTDETSIFALLEKRSNREVQQIKIAYADYFEGSDLRSHLRSELSGIWLDRLEAVFQGNDSRTSIRATYIAASALLYIDGDIEWVEMSRVLADWIGTQGKPGAPVVHNVIDAFHKIGGQGSMFGALKAASGDEAAALIDVVARGQSLHSSPEAIAIKLYHDAEGQWGTDEWAFSETLSSLAEHLGNEGFLALKPEIDAAYRRLYHRGLQSAIVADFRDSPAWMARVLGQWKGGSLDPYSIFVHASRGAGKPEEVLRAIGGLSLSERADFIESFNNRYGDFHRHLNRFADSDAQAISDQIALGSIASLDIGVLAERLRSQMSQERGKTGWDAISGTLMDTFGHSALFVDDGARNLFDSITQSQKVIEHARQDGFVSEKEEAQIASALQKVQEDHAAFATFVKDYQEERGLTAEVAGDVAAAVAATMVVVASGGTATPALLAVGMALGGGAKVATEKTFKGSQYELGEGVQDFVVGGIDGALTVATAGLAKGAQGLKAVGREALAGAAGGGGATGVRSALQADWDNPNQAIEKVLTETMLGAAVGAFVAAGVSSVAQGSKKLVQSYRGVRPTVAGATSWPELPPRLSETPELFPHGREVLVPGSNETWRLGRVLNEHQVTLWQSGKKGTISVPKWQLLHQNPDLLPAGLPVRMPKITGQGLDYHWRVLTDADGAVDLVNDLGTVRSVKMTELLQHNPGFLQGVVDVGGLGVVRNSSESLDEMLGDLWSQNMTPPSQSDIYRMYTAPAEVNPLTRSPTAYFDDLSTLARARPGEAVSNIQGLRGSMVDHLDVATQGLLDADTMAKLERGFFRFQRSNWRPGLISERIYINAAADHAPEVMAFLVRDIVDNPGAYPGIEMAKISGTRAVSRRAENIVLYTTGPEATEKVLEAISLYRQHHPNHFMRSIPKMTDGRLPGVAVGAEPIAELFDGDVSFGTARAQVIHRSLTEAKQAGLEFDQFRALVRQNFKKVGIDPNAPHLNLPRSNTGDTVLMRSRPEGALAR
jgi:hypothetical protein